MSRVDWTITATLRGDFYIDRVEESHGGAPVVAGLRRIKVEPEEDEQGQHTGNHSLEAVVGFDPTRYPDGEFDSAVFALAKQLVDKVAALVSFGTGRPVWVVGGIHAKLRVDGVPPTIRLITGVTKHAEFAPPAPLPFAVLGQSIDDRMQRVIRWWAKGLSTQDAVDRLVALNSALDLIAGIMEGVPGRTRRCRTCGAEESIGPGLRERVLFFLTGLGVDEGLAKRIYESRNDLSHARSDLNEDDLHRFRDHARVVAEAVRNGVARELTVNLPPIPVPLPVDPASGFIVIEATTAEECGRA